MGKFKGKTPRRNQAFKSPTDTRRITRSAATPGTPGGWQSATEVIFKLTTSPSPEAPIKPTRRSSVYRRIGTTRRTTSGESYSLALENTPKEFKMPLPQNKRQSLYNKTQEAAASPTLTRSRRTSTYQGRVTKPQIKSPVGTRARRASVYQKSESKPKSPALTRSRRASLYVKPPAPPTSLLPVPQRKKRVASVEKSPPISKSKQMMDSRRLSLSKSVEKKHSPSPKKRSVSPKKHSPLQKKRTPSPKRSAAPKMPSPSKQNVSPKAPQTPKLSPTSFYKSPVRSSKQKNRVSPVAAPAKKSRKTPKLDKSPRLTLVKSPVKLGQVVQRSPKFDNKSAKKAKKPDSRTPETRVSTPVVKSPDSTKKHPVKTPVKSGIKKIDAKTTRTPTKPRKTTPKISKMKATPKGTKTPKERSSEPAKSPPDSKTQVTEKTVLVKSTATVKKTPVTKKSVSVESPITPFKPVRVTAKTPLKTALTLKSSPKLPAATPAKAAKVLGVGVKIPSTKRKTPSRGESPSRKQKKTPSGKTPKSKKVETPSRKATPKRRATPGRKADTTAKIGKESEIVKLPKTSTPVRGGRKRQVTDSPPVSEIRTEKRRKDNLGEAIPANVTLLETAASEQKVQDMSLALPSSKSWFGWCNIL